MTKWKVVLCALIAAFTFAALATPALAKKEFKREFTASGPAVKLETRSVGEQTFVFPFEEKSSIKVKCAGIKAGPGEIMTTEGVAQSFTVKISYENCSTKGKKKQHVEAVLQPFEWEYHANGTATIVNEPKVEVSPLCTILLSSGQTMGAEEAEEGKKGPETYVQLGKSAPEGTPEVEVKTKTRTHEEGESDGLEYEGEGPLCETGEFKEEGGKLTGNEIVKGKAKETWIGFKEELLPKM